MKHIKLIILAFVSCVALMACGGDGDPAPITPPIQSEVLGAVYSETINIPAAGCDKTYTLSKLSSRVSSCSTAPNWFTVSILSYTYGAPSIKITAKENTERTERRENVVLTTANNDKLVLAVVQAAGSGSTGQTDPTTSSGIDDVHNGTSPNPAYSKRM